MLEPPFSRALGPAPLEPAHLRTSSPSSTSPKVSIHHTVPATTRSGNTISRVIDDLDAYYASELRTGRLDDINEYLWLAGLPKCGRPLHRQQLLGREIIITEDPNEHFVWHETRIYIKPVPGFLLEFESWTERICKDTQLFQAACGFLLSYTWLIQHESDLRLAHEKGLVPASMSWASWTDLMSDFTEHIDLQSLSGISPRYQYGELRLSRLDKIYRLTRFSWTNLIRGYMTTSTWYQEFFTRNFAWLIAVFAFMSVVLSAMQVTLATVRGGKAFEDTSYGFSIASLVVVAGIVLTALLLWAVLFGYNLASAWMNNRRVMRERSSNVVTSKQSVELQDLTQDPRNPTTHPPITSSPLPPPPQP